MIRGRHFIGHVSTSATLDVYTHSTEAIQREAAQCIDEGLGNLVTTQPTAAEKPSQTNEFQPYKGKIKNQVVALSMEWGVFCFGTYLPERKGHPLVLFGMAFLRVYGNA